MKNNKIKKNLAISAVALMGATMPLVSVVSTAADTATPGGAPTAVADADMQKILDQLNAGHAQNPGALNPLGVDSTDKSNAPADLTSQSGVSGPTAGSQAGGSNAQAGGNGQAAAYNGPVDAQGNPIPPKVENPSVPQPPVITPPTDAQQVAPQPKQPTDVKQPVDSKPAGNQQVVAGGQAAAGGQAVDNSKQPVDVKQPVDSKPAGNQQAAAGGQAAGGQAVDNSKQPADSKQPVDTKPAGNQQAAAGQQAASGQQQAPAGHHDPVDAQGNPIPPKVEHPAVPQMPIITPPADQGQLIPTPKQPIDGSKGTSQTGQTAKPATTDKNAGTTVNKNTGTTTTSHSVAPTTTAHTTSVASSSTHKVLDGLENKLASHVGDTTTSAKETVSKYDGVNTGLDTTKLGGSIADSGSSASSSTPVSTSSSSNSTTAGSSVRGAQAETSVGFISALVAMSLGTVTLLASKMKKRK